MKVLDEELPIARQTRHKDAARRWLQFKETPGQEQTQALRQSGWLALDAEQHVWEGEQAIPEGIAFRNYGARNYSPLEEKAREEQGREAARAHTAQTLTSAAKARHDQFLRDYDQSMERFVQGPTYLIRQLPARPEVLLSQAETDANLHTHAGYATDLEALYQALQRREPHGIILLMEFREGKIVSQVKATCDRGHLIHLRRREPDSDLFPVLLAQAERINAISVRERLIQRWKTEEETRTKSRDFEIFTIEWLPLSRKIHREDAQANREPYQARAAETILRLMGVSSAYAFGLQIAEFLSDIPGYVPLPDAQALLAELEEQYNAATTALSQAAPEGLVHIVEYGRKMGFSLLMHEARKFLLPLHLQDSEENTRFP